MNPELPQPDPAAVAIKSRSLDEYKSLRDETLKRVEFRNQLWNFTLITAGGILTFGTAEHGTKTAFLVYPVIILFFAAAFSYNTLMLINIGSYIREVCENGVTDLGWANYLKPRYREIERLEHVAKYGLFLGTEMMMFAFGASSIESTFTSTDKVAIALGAISIGLTFIVIRIPEKYHSKTDRGL